MEQVICRLTLEEKQAFQMKCLKENVKMQTVLKGAVMQFIKIEEKEGNPNIFSPTMPVFKNKEKSADDEKVM